MLNKASLYQHFPRYFLENFQFFMSRCMYLDPEVLTALHPWKQIIDAKGRSVIGISKVALEKKPCSVGECDLANFMADAMVHHFIAKAHRSNQWNGAVIGLVPTGDIRATIDKGGTSLDRLSL